MKYLVLCFLVLIALIAVDAASEPGPVTHVRHGPPPYPDSRAADGPVWGKISQRQDHFDATNPNRWNMRYLSEDKFYKEGGAIFIMIGGEWTINNLWLTTGMMYDLAEALGGMMYYTEHRYFGESYPVPDLTTPNMKYLSVDQGLADIANFIVQMKNSNPSFNNSKVIVFGGSYGGTLATWMRQKYPQLVHGAIAASAPLIAELDFYQYYDVMQTDLGPACASVLQNAAKQIREYLDNGDSAIVEKDFKICSPFKNDLDVQTLFYTMASQLANVIQTGRPSNVQEICSKLQNTTLGTNYQSVISYFKSPYCVGNFQWVVNSFRNTSLNSGDSRPWVYLTCTNFGWAMSAWGPDSLFNYGISTNFTQAQCTELFGQNFTDLLPENVNATNVDHGALNVGATRVFTYQGELDPWHSIGVLEDINPESPTVVVPGYGHIAVLYSMNTLDSPEMLKCKQDIVSNVEKWLQV